MSKLFLLPQFFEKLLDILRRTLVFVLETVHNSILYATMEAVQEFLQKFPQISLPDLIQLLNIFWDFLIAAYLEQTLLLSKYDPKHLQLIPKHLVPAKRVPDLNKFTQPLTFDEFRPAPVEIVCYRVDNHNDELMNVHDIFATEDNEQETEADEQDESVESEDSSASSASDSDEPAFPNTHAPRRLRRHQTGSYDLFPQQLSPIYEEGASSSDSQPRSEIPTPPEPEPSTSQSVVSITPVREVPPITGFPIEDHHLFDVSDNDEEDPPMYTFERTNSETYITRMNPEYYRRRPLFSANGLPGTHQFLRRNRSNIEATAAPPNSPRRAAHHPGPIRREPGRESGIPFPMTRSRFSGMPPDGFETEPLFIRARQQQAQKAREQEESNPQSPQNQESQTDESSFLNRTSSEELPNVQCPHFMFQQTVQVFHHVPPVFFQPQPFPTPIPLIPIPLKDPIYDEVNPAEQINTVPLQQQHEPQPEFLSEPQFFQEPPMFVPGEPIMVSPFGNCPAIPLSFMNQLGSIPPQDFFSLLCAFSNLPPQEVLNHFNGIPVPPQILNMPPAEMCNQGIYPIHVNIPLFQQPFDTPFPSPITNPSPEVPEVRQMIICYIVCRTAFFEGQFLKQEETAAPDPPPTFSFQSNTPAEPFEYHKARQMPSFELPIPDNHPQSNPFWEYQHHDYIEDRENIHLAASQQFSHHPYQRPSQHPRRPGHNFRYRQGEVPMRPEYEREYLHYAPIPFSNMRTYFENPAEAPVVTDETVEPPESFPEPCLDDLPDDFPIYDANDWKNWPPLGRKFFKE